MIKESAAFLTQNIDYDKKEGALVCVWNMGSECEGETCSRRMFKGQLSIPVCDRHYIEHVMLMCVRNLCDIDVEHLVEATWARAEMFKQEFGSESLSPEVCRDILARVRNGDKGSLAHMSDSEVARAVVEELPV